MEKVCLIYFESIWFVGLVAKKSTELVAANKTCLGDADEVMVSPSISSQQRRKMNNKKFILVPKYYWSKNNSRTLRFLGAYVWYCNITVYGKHNVQQTLYSGPVDLLRNYVTRS